MYDDRLHPPGISTSSNSSWTFSNSHDLPKPRKGRLCGIFLIGAVLVVALAVIAIGGLAFYIGGYTMERHHVNEYNAKENADANRQYSIKKPETPRKPEVKTTGKLKTTTEENIEATASERNQTKRITPGAILGLSKTMQEFNKNLKERTEEEKLDEKTTDEYEISTETALNIEEELVKPVILTKNIEILPKKPKESSEDKEEEEEEEEFLLVEETIGGKNVAGMQNGHARPNYSMPRTKTSTITSTSTTKPSTTTAAKLTSTTSQTNLFFPEKDYSDEPWKPIIPSYRDAIRIRNSYHEKYPERVFEHRYGPVVDPVIEDDSLITFSKNSFDQNLKITPEYGGNEPNLMFKSNQDSATLDEAAAKYEDFVIEDHLPHIPQIFSRPADDEIVTAPSFETADIIVSDSVSSKVFTPNDAIQLAEEKSNESETVEFKETGPSSNVFKQNVTTNIPKIATPSEIQTTPKPATIKAMLKVKEANVRVPEMNPKKGIDLHLVNSTEATSTNASITSTQSTVDLSKTSSASTLTVPSNTEDQGNKTVENPFADDSRSSSSKFGLDLPDLPILKQFQHLESLFKTISKPTVENGTSQSLKFSVRSEVGNETTITRFPLRTKQTTAKSFKKEDTIFVEVSTVSPEQTTKAKTQTSKPAVIRGEVEVVSGPIKKQSVAVTTEIPKLITLLPVRSNVNMMRPLRPRPKSNINSTLIITNKRNSKMNLDFKPSSNNSSDLKQKSSTFHQQHVIHDKFGKRWIYYPSPKPSSETPVKNEKLYIVTPEPKIEGREQIGKDRITNFTENLTTVPIYNTIESLLNLDHRNREVSTHNSSLKRGSNDDANGIKKNTSDIVKHIVKIMENVAISTGNSPQTIIKVNQTLLNQTTDHVQLKNGGTNFSDAGISTKMFSSHYKLNQAGVPVLTKVLNKAPGFKNSKHNMTNVSKNVTKFKMESLNAGCGDTQKCENVNCLSSAKKCNQFVDCPDAADEKNCTCADHLKSQQLYRKLCDGVVDCWDFSDEYSCEWCKKEFLCSNSKMCIKKTQICDGTNDCPFGDDERNCVTVSPNETEAETFAYHHTGYLMVRKNGQWGKLCIDNFESVSVESKTGWKISDLGRSVCKALTFKDFDKVERMTSIDNEKRSLENEEKYYELSYKETSKDSESSRNSVLTFRETSCTKKEVVKVTCTDLECGLRPQATTQRSRIVGGGNAEPGSWPWQAALYKEGEFQCGGTLISENWLISAGHCFFHNQESYWVARLGTLRTSFYLPSPYEQLRQISKIILHPQYLENGFINDISLLKMKNPIKLTDYVRPICLPKPQSVINDGIICTVVGWGQLSEVGWVFPDTLQEVQLPILSTSECRKKTLFLPLYKITDDMFCAGYDRGGRDACLGDSGGPLMCTETDGKWILTGITSNGYGCGRSNRPGVYTKVSKYLDWINSQILDSSIFLGTAEFKVKKKADSSVNFAESTTQTLHEENTNSIAKKLPNDSLNFKENSTFVKNKSQCLGHRCPLGECLHKSKLCDGHIECSDGSDEKDCW